MKSVFFILFYFLFFNCFSQDQTNAPVQTDNNNSESGFAPGYRSVNIQAGIMHVDLGKLNSLQNNKHLYLSNNLNIVGLELKSLSTLNSSSIFDSHIALQYLFSDRARSGDSASLQLSGYYLGIDMGRDLLLKNNRFDLLLCLGFNIGQLNLKRTAETRNTEDFNSFFAPKIVLEPSFTQGLLFISIKAEYCYYLSGTTWIGNVNDRIRSNSQGFNLQGCAGINF